LLQWTDALITAQARGVPVQWIRNFLAVTWSTIHPRDTLQAGD
jgi:hypothetical protein